MRRKLFITYIILVMVGSLITGALCLSFVRTYYVKNIQDKLVSNGNLITTTLLNLVDEKNEIDYMAMAQKFSSQTNAEISFINDKGYILADSSDSLMLENQINKPEIQNCLHGKTAVSDRYSKVKGERFIYVALSPVKIYDNKVIVRLGMSLKGFDNLNKVFLSCTLISILIGVIVAVVIGCFFLDNMMNPLQKLNNAAKRISNGNFNHKVRINTKDELEELANSFNNMSSTINNVVSQLNYRNLELNSILNSITYGILVIDINWNIILSNPAVIKILRLDKNLNIGDNLKNSIESQELYNLIEETFDNNVHKEKELGLRDNDDKIYKVYTKLIDYDVENLVYEKGIVIILQDISEIKHLEKMRSEFVANVSHELKTPLTTIIGFVDTLKRKPGEDKEKRQRFLGIISEEVERLKRLIEDILLLSHLENQSSSNNLEEVNIYKELDDILYMLTPSANRKNIGINLIIEKNFTLYVKSKDWFKQAVMNLIDNAIKYTQPEGHINVSAYIKENNALIIVKDNGVGIPKEDISRVFERFYRVDKSRSRSEGGTGLGLAIVKHIVSELDGSIYLNSELNKGSEFIIQLPLNKLDAI
ncbi:histidine kinase [Clostridium carboxidivorans P7]|uniref:histidine kinase n=1 Tax=Clostridium carboxidivorans P7 TaxID=536227 RepID=C6Q0N0_9CLOT|nr:HAMP domain-containing sensor histidine kinase [Clostridium carboxidivorans]AKN31606.1 histidine kinase [Clostridium carboxidivorans P7]EET84945.1 PAS/PAC sensor signal transduction histidine kinase [Clostridium carboxidivorans P7]EFG86979.1 ATPase, histidine kinase-, DNA gyrase B-, and HSP90-like domain protein [Clostridium carboxidivorans P7]